MATILFADVYQNMIIFQTSEQLHSYLGYRPVCKSLTVCHENGVFKRGFGGEFVFFALYKGEYTKVFYKEGFYFQISCYMYEAVEPVDPNVVDLIQKHTNVGICDTNHVFWARPFKIHTGTTGTGVPI